MSFNIVCPNFAFLAIFVYILRGKFCLSFLMLLIAWTPLALGMVARSNFAEPGVEPQTSMWKSDALST